MEYIVAEDDEALQGWGGAPLVALAGGTGTRISGTGIPEFDRRILRRMNIQDKAVLVMLLVIYTFTLLFGLSITYRMAINDSPVKYYADPRYHSLVCEDSDAENFLDAFNQTPKNVNLQVVGFLPAPDALESIFWRGENYQMAFCFSLDLSPWVVHFEGPEDEGRATQQEGEWDDAGLHTGDMEKLQDFLVRGNSNALAAMVVHKQVEWPGWEDIATNIKHRIRQQGFAGVISIRRTDTDRVCVFQNKPWANFMHNKTTKVLAALSCFGGLLYVPYMWLRCSETVIRSRFRVDVSLSEYWNLISDRLCADGFEASA